MDVAGVELRFEAGRVVDARAERGEAYLLETLDTDEGARRLGELGIGTNTGLDRPTGLILLDEKIGGTVHLALGRSYPETGRSQRERRALGPDLRPARTGSCAGRRGARAGVICGGWSSRSWRSSCS